MTPKNLFIIILKILGIFFIKDIVEAIPQLLSGLRYIGNESNIAGKTYLFIYGLTIFIIYLLVSWLLIFKAEAIVNRLKLGEGFDQEKFPFHVSPHSILMVAVIATGLFILIVEIPNFFEQLYLYFQYRQLSLDRITGWMSRTIFTGIKILLALLLMGERKRLVDFILRRQALKAAE